MKKVWRSLVLKFARQKSPTANIVVWTILDSDGNGNLRGFPVGAMPRLPKEKERQIVEEANGEIYQGTEIADDSAIACIVNGSVDAVCFFTAQIAGKHATKLFDAEMIALINKSDGMFDHFPRSKLADK